LSLIAGLDRLAETGPAEPIANREYIRFDTSEMSDQALESRLTVINALVAYRAFAGTAIWVAPGLTARVFRFESDRGRYYLGRLAGSRQVALAAGTALSKGDAQRLWLRLGLACDVLDTLAAVIGGAKGVTTPRQAASEAAATLVEVALSTLALAKPAPNLG
jgi:hypothetical protein